VNAEGEVLFRVEETDATSSEEPLARENAIALRRCLLPYASAFALGCLLLVPPAIVRPLQSSDEGRYAEVARETFVYHHWLIPHNNGVPHLTKSPFYYDLVAISYSIFGTTPFALRMVSVLASLFGLLFTMRWAARYGRRGAAVLCAAVSLTMVHPAGAGQFGDLNTLLTFFLTVGLLLIFTGIESADNRAAWYLGWAFAGLAFLTKGPPALFIPAGTLLLYRWISGRKLNKPAAWWGGGLLIFCLLGFSWYAWMLAKEGKALWDFWKSDLVQRTSLRTGSRPVYDYLFYAPVFLAGSSGWGIYMVWRAWLAIRWRKRAGRCSWLRALARAIRSLPAPEQWLLAWLAVTLAAFAAMRATMMSYIQPAYPAAALLLSLYFARRYPGRMAKPFGRMATLAGFITVAALWGVSFFQYGLVRRGDAEKALGSDTVEFNILARKMAAQPTSNWTLAQCRSYQPLFCFLTRRMAMLCETQVHTAWPSPPDLSLTAEELRRRMASKEPMMVLIKREKIKEFFPLPIPGMRVLVQGPTLLVVSNLP